MKLYFDFIKDVGLCFLESANKIIRKKIEKKWTARRKDDQLIKRGRYVEFNLLYDRGTKFGLNTGGNVEAILMSLPPTAKTFLPNVVLFKTIDIIIVKIT